MKKFNRILSGLGLGLMLTSIGFAGGTENAPKKEKRAQQKVEIKVTPWGPSQADVDQAKARVERSPTMQKELAGTKYRILGFNYLETEDKSRPTQAPTRFQITFYDYTNDRTLIADAGFDAGAPVSVRQAYFQPNPTDEEFEEAVRMLERDPNFAAQFKGGTLRAFRPMPPVTVLDGTTERMVNVGLEAAGGDTSQNEVVSVRIVDGEVIRYEKRAPETSRAAPDACGIPAANQQTSSQGTAGQYQMTVTQGATTLWNMLVIRPSASSGTAASGIEIRDVKYKGKSVLKRGHVPVLNVEYGGGQCGPYRDWQYQEDQFDAPAAGATDPASGIRVLAAGQTAKTALDNGTDTGNFRGVAIYTQDAGYGQEVVMVTELQAGWYRYIMEWRFAPDGTIRPRYGFGATNNNCVCFVHNHHAYWRFDFDIVGSNNKVFQVERGRKFLQPILTETFRNKNLQTNRSLLIQNSAGDEAYTLVPSKTDGVADAFGAHDMWVLRYKSVAGGTAVQNEIDDGRVCCGSIQNINIDPWINNESVLNQDVVVWYGTHFIHADGANLLDPNRSPTVLTNSHVVGPDLRPVRW